MKKERNKKSKLTPEYDPQRQQNVLLEDIRKKVETVAEGHSGLNRKIDTTNEWLDQMDGRLEIIVNKVSGNERRLSGHDKRFDRIEMVVTENRNDIKGLQVNVKRIEQKLDTVTTNHEQRIRKLESVR